MEFAGLDSILLEASRAVAPAIVCRIERRGEVVYEAAFGSILPWDAGSPITAECMFDLASVTKLFTTTACLRLCTDGDLPLDTPVAEVLPEFGGLRPIGATEDPITKLPIAASPYWQTIAPAVDAGAITIQHLLTHTSGLPAWRNVFSACGEPPAAGNTLTSTEIGQRQERGLAAICGYDFAYMSGMSYAYSDIGLILLGAVVGKAYGQARLDVAVRELVTLPLGLSVSFNPSRDMSDHVAPTEYCPWRGRRLHGEVHDENAAGLGGIAGQAGLFGTAKDLCRLGRVYLRHGENLLDAGLVQDSVACQIAANAPGEPLSDPERPCATPNPEIRRGLGWMLPANGSSCGSEWSRNGFGHTGYTGTSLWCDPDQDVAVALLTNRVYWGRDPEPVYQLRLRVHSLVARATGGFSP